MSRPTFDPIEQYVGANNLAIYSFAFKITLATQLLIIVTDASNVEVERVRGDDVTYLSTLVFDADEGGGTVTLQANLPTGYTITLLLADDAPTQPFEFRDKFSFTLKRFEAALDWLSGQIQRLSWLSSRSIRLNDAYGDAFDTQLPMLLDAERTIIIGADGLSMELGPTRAELIQGGEDAQTALDAATAAQAAQAAAEVAQAAAEAAAGAAGDVSYDGFSSRFSEIFTSVGLKDTLDKILKITYVGPAVSLGASGNGTIREKGTAVTSTTLTAAVVKKSDPIAAVRFYLGASLINTVASPSPTGGNETYGWTGSFSDNTTFNVQVDDTGATGGPTTASASASFTFVYPYYNDAGAAGKSAAQVGALSKTLIGNTLTVTKTMTATNGQVFYFAYPASYGALTSILDVNNFETIADWNVSTANITGLDGNAVSYKIYEFKNPVVAGSYQYTFKR